MLSPRPSGDSSVPHGDRIQYSPKGAGGVAAALLLGLLLCCCATTGPEQEFWEQRRDAEYQCATENMRAVAVGSKGGRVQWECRFDLAPQN